MLNTGPLNKWPHHAASQACPVLLRLPMKINCCSCPPLTHNDLQAK